MTALERRYRRLVRICYPAGYRREWGAEIVDTYLALSAPARRWPPLADVTDVVKGGIGQRVRAAGGTAPGSGVPLAATLALVTVSALAGGGTVLELNPWTAAWAGYQPNGTVVSPGLAVWAVWWLAAVAHLVTPGRRTRLVIGLALVLTVMVIPVAAVFESTRPPLYVLFAHACLGLVAAVHVNFASGSSVLAHPQHVAGGRVRGAGSQPVPADLSDRGAAGPRPGRTNRDRHDGLPEK